MIFDLFKYQNLSLLSLQVSGQNLDVWKNTPACVPDALRHYYYQYLASTSEAAEVNSEIHDIGNLFLNVLEGAKPFN